MIIKSGARKTATFSQLVDYMNKEEVDKRYRVLNNVYGNKAEYIKKRFLENSKKIKARKNGNFLYHEILSISKTNKLTDDQQKEKLNQICKEYVEKRAKNNLVYAVLHEGENNDYHYHVMFSANEVDSNKKTRLSTKQFDFFKKKFNKHVLEKYPELNQENVIEKKNDGEKLSNKGHELQKRTGKPPPKKERVKTSLKKIFETTTTKQEFFDSLQRENLKFNDKGKTISFTDLETGRSFRIKTLGIDSEFWAMSQRVELETKQTTKTSRQRGREQTEEQYKQAQGQKEHVKPSTQDTKKKQDESPKSEQSTHDKKQEEAREKVKGQNRGTPGRDEKVKKAKEELKVLRKLRESKSKTKTKTKK